MEIKNFEPFPLIYCPRRQNMQQTEQEKGIIVVERSVSLKTHFCFLHSQTVQLSTTVLFTFSSFPALSLAHATLTISG